MALAYYGFKRLLLALVVSPVVLLMGTIALVDRRNDLCEPLTAFPGVTCPPLSERATSAANVSLVLGVIVAIGFAALARAPRRTWLEAVTTDHEPYRLPAAWRILTMLSWFSLLVGALFATVFSAVVYSGPESGPIDPTASFPVVMTGILLGCAALLWTSWRYRRLVAIANRRAGSPVFQLVASPGGSGTGYGGADHSRRSSHRTSAGWPAGGDDGSSGFDGADGAVETQGYPRTGSLFGDGPQHGTTSLADQQGNFYNEDHRDLRPPAEQPGNFYSSDPFGRDPE